MTSGSFLERIYEACAVIDGITPQTEVIIVALIEIN
jgi:hypothetical protein